MPERLNAIDGDDWNVILVTSEQLAVTFNIDFLKRIFIIAVGRLHCLFGFFAKMTARACI